MPKKAFITGVTGFTGSHMAEFLIRKGLYVGGIAKSEKRLRNIKDFKNQLRFWACDLSQIKKLKKILSDFSPDFVFHFASPIIRTQKMDIEVLQKNLETDLFGTLNLLKAIKSLSKYPKILISGSAAEYAILDNKPIKENQKLLPKTPYGLSKLIQELASFSFAKNNKLPLLYSRTFHLIGPKQEPIFVVSDFAKQVAEIKLGLKNPILKTGNLQVKRDFTDVRDAVRAYWLIATKAKNYEIFNLCSQKSYSIKQIVQFLLSLTTKKIKVSQQKERLRKEEPKQIIGCNQKLCKLGWQPKITLKKTLSDTLHYWKILNQN